MPDKPAFPRPASIDTSSGTLPDGDSVVPEQAGMSLREYVATHTLAGLLANPSNAPDPKSTPEGWLKATVRCTLAYTDGLLAELAKPVPVPVPPPAPPDDGEECPLCGKPLGDEQGVHQSCAEDEAARADR